MSGITLRELQTNLPWPFRHTRDFRATPASHKDFAHALHHVGKALGKLHELAADLNREELDPAAREANAKYAADLVVCALRIANTFPGGTIDLEKSVMDRIEEKISSPIYAAIKRIPSKEPGFQSSVPIPNMPEQVDPWIPGTGSSGAV